MSNKIREIIVYKIQADKVDEFQTIKAQMLKESAELKGMVSATTAKLLDSENTFADTMVWESKEASEKALPAFEALPTAGKFLSLFDGPPLHHLFMEYQPDQLN